MSNKPIYPKRDHSQRSPVTRPFDRSQRREREEQVEDTGAPADEGTDKELPEGG